MVDYDRIGTSEPIGKVRVIHSHLFGTRIPLVGGRLGSVEYMVIKEKLGKFRRVECHQFCSCFRRLISLVFRVFFFYEDGR